MARTMIITGRMMCDVKIEIEFNENLEDVNPNTIFEGIKEEKVSFAGYNGGKVCLENDTCIGKVTRFSAVESDNVEDNLNELELESSSW